MKPVQSPRGVFAAVPVAGRRAAERTKAQVQDNRVHNRSLVLAALYHQGAMSRAELSRATALTAPTVSALVADLEADGLVADVEPPAEPGTRRRGKPSMLVEVQDDAVSLVVLDLAHAEQFRGAVTDLRGRILVRRSIDIGDAAGEEALALVLRLAEELMELAGARVLGIGVATPGIVDDEGTVRQAGHLGWYDLPMAARISERFGVPARVGNDVNSAALAALNFGRADAQNLMVVTTEFGVGAGLVVDGRLVEGEQFAAGEIGHLTVDPNGETCEGCGRRGCLEPLIDAARLRARLDRNAPEDRDRILAEAGRALGTVLATVAAVLNLNEFLLVGPGDLIEGPFLDSASATARACTLSPINAALTVRYAADGADLALLGAASLLLTAELGVF
ncbi:ROK family protein [Kitasatospora sp. NPDC048365]|uniref:ROK family transcriptional regulator n=1 Tax=Kitasatospora sp. NPDC048365 TaxID=3364050 RepID=UPI00371B881F